MGDELGLGALVDLRRKDAVCLELSLVAVRASGNDPLRIGLGDSVNLHQLRNAGAIDIHPGGRGRRDMRGWLIVDALRKADLGEEQDREHEAAGYANPVLRWTGIVDLREFGPIRLPMQWSGGLRGYGLILVPAAHQITNS